MNQQISVKRHWIFLFCALAALLLLSACGGKIDTTLTINADGGGTRQMNVDVEKKDLDKVQGGAKDLETQIKQNLPSGLEYQGQENINGGGVRFKFNLPFKNLEEYQKKATDILAAGGTVTEDGAKVELLKGTEPFSVGSSYRESFTSQQLLRWIPKALVKAQKLAEGDESNALEEKTATLVLDGKPAVVQQPFRVGKIERFGLAKTEVNLVLGEDGKYSAEVTAQLPPGVYSRDKAGYDSYFQKAAETSGGKVDKSGGEGTWTIKQGGLDEAGVTKLLQSVYSDKENAFSHSTASVDTNPFAINDLFKVSAHCPVICNDGVTPQLKLGLPASWGQSDAPKPMTFGLGGGERNFARSISFSDVKAALNIAPDASGKLEIIAKMSLTQLNSLSDRDQRITAISDALKGESEAKVITNEDGEDLEFKIVAEDGEAARFNSKLETLGVASKSTPAVTVMPNENANSLTTKGYLVDVKLHAPRALQGHLAESIKWEIKGISGLKITEPITLNTKADVADGIVSATGEQIDVKVAAETSSLTTLLMIGGGIGAFLLLGAIITLLLVISQRRKKRKQQLQSTPTEVIPALPPGDE